MSGAWDDSDDDDWDKSDDELDARLGLVAAPAPKFDDDEEDLALIEKERAEKSRNESLKTKGKALAAKKQAEADRKEEEILARKTMELEAEMEAKMTIDERRALERKRVEEADHALADDLFGAVEGVSGGPGAASGGKAMAAGDTVKLNDLKDHLKHARKVAQCLTGHKKIRLAAAFLKECIQESKDALDDDSIADIIKTCNIIKNEKLQAAKRKVKGQAQKSKKKDKVAEKKAKQMAVDLYGENDQYDDYDAYGADYEDAFF
jgi:translation initiation factor 3 subunit J